jgi:hypothetical protein
LNYVVAGDTEGFVYLDKRWVSLVHPPSSSDSIRYKFGVLKVRLNTSYTPGGLGKSHGDYQRIWGTYIWPEYRSETKAETTRGFYNEFLKHSNNIHFGQCLLSADDYCIFASDGLGDTLDPIQLFPRPKLIHGLEEYNNWQDYAKLKDSAVTCRQLKQLALERVLGSVMSPYDQECAPTAKSILEATLQHCTDVTRGDRVLYNDRKFYEASRGEKQVMMEKKIEKWVDGSMKRVMLGKGVKFALPSQFVPFAKVDHLGIQVLQPKLCKQ